MNLKHPIKILKHRKYQLLASLSFAIAGLLAAFVKGRLFVIHDRIGFPHLLKSACQTSAIAGFTLHSQHKGSWTYVIAGLGRSL